MIYFQSKYLAEKLNIKLARWKRWSREFLPPDPLGGLRSGYARQFNYRDAFTVYLGGRLVSRLGFSIPDACRVLEDLSPWLHKHGYFDLPAENRDTAPFPQHQVRIIRRSNAGFGYEIRTGVQGGESTSDGWRTERYRRSLIHLRRDDPRLLAADYGWVVFIDTLYRSFLSRLGV